MRRKTKRPCFFYAFAQACERSGFLVFYRKNDYSMSLVEYTLTGKIDKVKIAVNRIKAYDPIKNGFMDTPFYTAYSGGKDGDTIRILCELAGVKYDLVHNHTTVDAPETVRYVRSFPNVQISYPEITMWRLIVKKKMPPTRLIRYCCSELKERGGRDRFVMTGVRWEESTQRKSRSSLEILGGRKDNCIILNADNDESRRQFEMCTKQGKRVLNPIIDWTTAEVWEFLSHYGCESNPLYKCGYKRIGCIGCPMSSRQAAEFERYPKYKQAYIRTFDRMLKENTDVDYRWDSGEDVFKWWITRRKAPKEIEGQIMIDIP